MINYSVLEWGQLQIDKNVNTTNESITPENALSLFAASEKLPICKHVSGGILTLHHNRITARGVVGVIQSRTCSLEILPKIEVEQENDIKERNITIKKKLIEMIAVAYNTKISIGSISSMSWQKDTLLEILIGVFAKKLIDLVRVGMPKKYIEHEEDLATLRGMMDMTRQFTLHAADPSKLACRYDEFSHDIPLNQVMKSAIFLLSNLSKNVRNQTMLRELKLIFSEITFVPVNDIRWDLITIDRTNRQWQDLFSLTKFLLNQKYQTSTRGSIDSIKGYALLFEMNKLFEEYVGRLVQKVAKKLNKENENIRYSVKLQSGNKYCLFDESTNEEVFKTKPDIIIRQNENVIQIIDTKWKHITNKEVDIWNSVNQSDIYQMMAYEQLHETPVVTLFYPHNSDIVGGWGVKSTGKITTNENKSIKIFSFDLTDNSIYLNQIEKLFGIS